MKQEKLCVSLWMPYWECGTRRYEMLFCKHKWKILKQINQYAPGAELPYKITYILTCDKCGKIKKVKGT